MNYFTFIDFDDELLNDFWGGVVFIVDKDTAHTEMALVKHVGVMGEIVGESELKDFIAYREKYKPCSSATLAWYMWRFTGAKEFFAIANK